jgi:hypothetical protein
VVGADDVNPLVIQNPSVTTLWTLFCKRFEGRRHPLVVVEVFNMPETTMSAKRNENSHAANTKHLATARTKNFQVRCAQVSMMVVSGDSCGGLSLCRDQS